MKQEKGFSLIEVALAMLLLGIVAVAFFVALSTGAKALLIADERTTAESLARTEMEYIKNCEYEYLSAPWSYELPSGPPPSWDVTHALPAGYDGYSLTVDGNLFDANGDGDVDADDEGIQKIIVTVDHHGKELIILEDYKVDR